MAYFVSTLQFVVPATIALFAGRSHPTWPMCGAPRSPLAGLVGIAGTLMLAYEMSVQTDAKILPAVFAVVGAPLYLLVFVVALWPGVVGDLELKLTLIEVEGVLLDDLGVPRRPGGRFVDMTPSRTQESLSVQGSRGLAVEPQRVGLVAMGPVEPTCLPLIFAPFLMTGTSAIAWPRPRSWSAFEPVDDDTALVAGGSWPRSWACATSSRGVSPVLSSMASR